MRNVVSFLLLLVFGWAGCHSHPFIISGEKPSLVIVIPANAVNTEVLAAREIRRYLYLRTGRLAPIEPSSGSLPSARYIVLAARKDWISAQEIIKDNNLKSEIAALANQGYMLKTLEDNRMTKTVLIAGGDDWGTLYGAYRFIEHLGVRFYLHGDTIPDERIAFRLPDVDETGKPLFALRGIQPFHDFPEGPDWWGRDDYKAIITQLPKLRMNFIGLHTYPEGGVGPEPTVWIGLAEDVAPDGTVNFSYPASHDSTLKGGNWGYAAMKTSDFGFGAAQLFERDAYAGEVMQGLDPWPQTPAKYNEVFQRMGLLLHDAFTLAEKLGVKTCIGTETPLTVPKLVKERLISKGRDLADPKVVQQVYEGIFERIKKTHPLDYYWFWTNENWTWTQVKNEEVEAVQNDLLTAVAAAQRVNAPFTLATCGWVLGPPQDRALFDKVLPKEMPFSCINRQVGKDPVEPQFAGIKDRPQWAIPWLEDDPGMISPQLWAGRMRQDAADALAYGCTGLMGIHWRMRILGPNVSALAQAAWDQGLTRKSGEETAISPPAAGVVGGAIAQFPNNPIADTEDDPLYQNVRYNMETYRLEVPQGRYKVTLQFCEPYYSEAGKRVFGVKLEDKIVIDKLDIFAQVGKDRALDYSFSDIEVNDGLLDVDFIRIVEFPCIAALAVEGDGFSRRINCGGIAYKDYDADLSAAPAAPRFMPADDFYADWALHEFGPEAADDIAEIFSRIDCRLPEPSAWLAGPGGIATNPNPWLQVRENYSFVEELAALRPRIRGRGNQERFDYWLNTFRYMKAMAQVGCLLGEMDKVMQQIAEEKDSERKNELARQVALPLRKNLLRTWGTMVDYLLLTVTNSSEMGTVANIEQHSMKKLNLLGKHDKILRKILGHSLPSDTQPWTQYRGPERIIVPTVRSSLEAGEDLRLKVIILSQSPPQQAELLWRPLGKGDYKNIPLHHIDRGVYAATIPAKSIKGRDIEYYVTAHWPHRENLYYPPAAPEINNTVITMTP